MSETTNSEVKIDSWNVERSPEELQRFINLRIGKLALDDNIEL